MFLNTKADGGDILKRWRRDYNKLRSHCSIGNLTPKEFLNIFEREENQSAPGSIEELVEAASSGFY